MQTQLTFYKLYIIQIEKKCSLTAFIIRKFKNISQKVKNSGQKLLKLERETSL